ncbi:MAG TPA: bifunctional serine/threonine-protein kinase/formylglycine-generating enzyme family protein [Pyrinomonadaceae bacterium]|nr:bifunctional serine/threonine-protein kinase/formylglycine-generating enzyme family protein [Pyrinomonadaceae bacterium]
MKECPSCRRCYPDDISHCPQDGDETTPSLLGEPTLDARYLLERRLGQGGMGVVFQARHIFLKTPHAIKVIIPDLVGNDPMLTTRFRQEALAAAAIRHQNIIAVTDFGVVRGTMPFLVMEFVKGRSLHEIMQKEGAMSPQRAFEFISAIAAGVGAAHRQNIVHRDLKPLNIMVQDDVPPSEGVKILDFGLAKIKSGELLGSFIQAQTSGLMGSPFYMAPEQWGDEEPDARADIYSLGVILYQMLAGEVPFKGSSIPSIMKKHLTMPPPSFQSMGVSVPPAIEALVRHALEKDIHARIDTVDNFLKELKAAIDATPFVPAAFRETVALDPNRTIASTTPPMSIPPGVIPTNTQAPISTDTNFETSLGALNGAVSDVDLAKEKQERAQQEKLDRMAQQAKDLEDRLARLSSSMPPHDPPHDPEATHVRQGSTAPALAAQTHPRQPVAGKPITVDIGHKSSNTRTIFIVLAVLAVVVLAGIGLTAYLAFGPKTQEDGPAATPSPTITPGKADLVAISGGSFLMGRNDGPPQETPAHAVSVGGFMMDRTEVTNTEYAEFVAATQREAPSHWIDNRPPFGQDKWPVVNISFEDANAFAAWRSKRDAVTYRLPTEEEWEYAARNGERADLYPWGPNWRDGIAVLKEATPAQVGSRAAGKNQWGVVDLVGNVWEWTSSRVSVYPGNPVIIPATTQDWIAIRGGCYVSDPNKSNAPVSACMREFVPPSTKTPLLGFRLVRSGS